MLALWSVSTIAVSLRNINQNWTASCRALHTCAQAFLFDPFSVFILQVVPLVVADSTGQGVCSWAVGQALSPAPINIVLPLVIAVIYFYMLVMSLSLSHR